MPGRNKFLFDSDVLITAKNLHYPPAVVPEFWDWIEAGHKAGYFYSIDKVKKELLNGGQSDPLYSWAQKSSLNTYFLDSKPAAAKWRELSAWATDPARPYLPAAQAKFLDAESADAWLVAYAAMAGDYTIMTNEVAAPESKHTIKIPDAALALGVMTIKLPGLFAVHAAAHFKFKP